MDSRQWIRGDSITAVRLEKTRKTANVGAIPAVDWPLGMTYHDEYMLHLRFDQSYGKMRWGIILRQSDIKASDNYCYLHPCVDSDATGANIESDTAIQCYFTTPIGVYASDVSVESDEKHLYRMFGGDDKGVLINPRTVPQAADIYMSDVNDGTTSVSPVKSFLFAATSGATVVVSDSGTNRAKITIGGTAGYGTTASDTIIMGSDVYVNWTSDVDTTEYTSDDFVGTQVFFTTRVFYDYTSSDPTLYGFQRLVKITHDRRIDSIGPEIRYLIDTPSDC